jgi:hypothetical protein
MRYYVDMSNGAAAVFGEVAANDVCATVSEDRARRLEPEYARLREVAKGHWTGAKYDKERPFTETAKLIRKELAAASKADGVLRGVKCTVKSGWSTYKRSLDIKIVEVATGDKMPIMNPARVEREMRNPHAAVLGCWLSKRGKEIEKAVETIARQYSYDKSDSMSDYHDTAFHISVTFASDVQASHRAEVEAAVRMAGRV